MLLEVSDHSQSDFRVIEAVTKIKHLPNNCAKRSLRSSASQKQMFRPFVRSFVRAFESADFRDFLPKEYEGWTHAA